MFKAACIFTTFFFISGLNALDSEECKLKPKEKHCLIEWSVRDQWPHQVRYVYDWSTRKCFEIRWSDNCPEVPSPPSTNNFPSDDNCMQECSGWA